MTLLWYSRNIIFGDGDRWGKEEWLLRKEEEERKEEEGIEVEHREEDTPHFSYESGFSTLLSLEGLDIPQDSARPCLRSSSAPRTP